MVTPPIAREMKKIFYIMTMAAIGITACSKSQAPDPDNSQAEDPVAETATTYHISIPATLGDGADTKAVSFDTNTITSGFVTTDNVCAYNKTRGNSLGGHLSPDANASNCTLTGDLSGTIKVGDNLLLVINNFTLRYDNQSGTPSSASLHDFSECVMKVKSVSPSLVLCQVDDENNTTAVFHKTGSMFRQSFSFQDYDGTPIATPERIQRIDLATANLSLVSRYFPREEGSDKYTMSHLEHSVTLFSGSSNVLDSNGNAYFALMFNYDAPPTPTSHDALLVFATDNNNNYYYVTKAAPSTGFQAGKYYYGNMTLTKTHKPTIVETSSGNQATPTQETNNYIQFPSVSITISGASAGHCYEFTGNSTITLTDGFSAEYVGLLPFIEASGKNIDLVLDGNASISSPYSFYAPILTTYLKLSGIGSLTITSKYPENCGIYGLNYYYYDNTDYTNAYNTTSEIDVSAQLAQPGYTVIRSARTDNPDGTYTWTYTVTPK